VATSSNSGGAAEVSWMAALSAGKNCSSQSARGPNP
jgi:hypothetical protein